MAEDNVKERLGEQAASVAKLIAAGQFTEAHEATLALQRSLFAVNSATLAKVLAGLRELAAAS